MSGEAVGVVVFVEEPDEGTEDGKAVVNNLTYCAK